MDERLYTELALALGDKLELGRSAFTVTSIITHEPDAAIGFINGAPRVLINEADLEATGLVQPGSRIGYRLQIAGAAETVDAYRAWAAARLKPGQRIEGIRDARPEIRSALERAEKFLHLAALVSVVLAAVAIGLSARRFLQRHLDACAMMRCLGAKQATVLRLYLVHFVTLGLVASVIGCALGMAAQAALALWLGQLVSVELPPPGGVPALYGAATGLALLLGFALPPLTALARVPTLRVLRRDLGAPRASGLAHLCSRLCGHRGAHFLESRGRPAGRHGAGRLYRGNDRRRSAHVDAAQGYERLALARRELALRHREFAPARARQRAPGDRTRHRHHGAARPHARAP